METGVSYKIAFVSNDNPILNILEKNKKSSKFRRDRKTLISAFAHFLSTNAKSVFLQGRLDSRLWPHAVLVFFLIFPYFLRS